MKRCLVVLLIGIILASCIKREEIMRDGIDYYFDEPQPVNDSELQVIPVKFRGRYSGANSTLNITDLVIFTEDSFNAAFHKSIIDSIGIYNNGKLTTNDTHDIFDAVIKGDSVYISNNDLRDTIFRISAVNKAKRINGDLVLSYKDSIFWKTKIISKIKDSLKIRNFNSVADYLILKPLVKNINTNRDTSVVHINPTRAEFKKILEIKTLGWELKYRKIK